MPTGTACGNNNSISISQFVQYICNTSQLYGSFVRINATTHTIGKRFWLFKNYLEHKMRITRFLNFLQTDRQFVNLFCQADVVNRLNIVTVSIYNRHFTIIEVNYFIGILNNW